MGYHAGGGHSPRIPGSGRFIAVTISILLLTLAGSANGATFTVAAVNFRFEPESRTVHVGDTVRWTFAGDPHSVTSGGPGSPDGRFDSGIKDPGSSFQFKFTTAGTFAYFCQIHPEQMFGTLVVQAGATPAPTAKPTPRPTARPTPRPTVRPTARPSPTATAEPTEAPTVGPAATASPATTASPTTSATASPSATATASAAPAPTVATSASPTLDAGSPAGSIGVVPILAIAVIVGLLGAGAVLLARRSRTV